MTFKDIKRNSSEADCMERIGIQRREGRFGRRCEEIMIAAFRDTDMQIDSGRLCGY